MTFVYEYDGNRFRVSPQGADGLRVAVWREADEHKGAHWEPLPELRPDAPSAVEMARRFVA